MSAKPIELKPGKDKPLKQRHHWIFSGAIQHYPKDYIDGEIVPVHNSQGECLGNAYFNRKCSLAGRMISFGNMLPLEAMTQHLDGAIALRNALIDQTLTNAYRVVNGEGDRLPGLIVDRYADTLVIQISTLGMERLREWVVEYLQRTLKPRAIYEKSQISSRQEEGLRPKEGILFGSIEDEIEIRENGLRFLVSIKEGQKTGFFLDHREMRNWVRTLSAGKRVLNAFAYTGGFSVYAMAGGASLVDTVEISDKALAQAKRNCALNEFSGISGQFLAVDVFDFLRDHPLDYDLVILDPPAFAKKQRDVIPACRGYKDINRLAMQKMPKKSLLMTSSCSYFIDEGLFQKVLFQAALEAGREVRIVGRHRLAVDHPINLYHPEGQYLKSFLLFVD